MRKKKPNCVTFAVRRENKIHGSQAPLNINTATKQIIFASRMGRNHSSVNGMRMQLAWWDIVDTWTYLRSKGKTWATWTGLRDCLSVIVMSWVFCKGQKQESRKRQGGRLRIWRRDSDATYEVTSLYYKELIRHWLNIKWQFIQDSLCHVAWTQF